MREMLSQSDAPPERQAVERDKLEALMGWFERADCRRHALLAYFGESREGECRNCDNCLEPPATWDATVAAQKLLSCMVRTGQRFGAGHVIDVLLGRSTERVLQLGHETLPTFGIGADLSAADWRGVVWQRGARSARTPRGDLPDIPPEDQPLWEALRQCRRTLAEAAGVPPYVVFHDATLRGILAARPSTLAEFRAVSGVGDAKLERYGQAFLDALAEHVEASAGRVNKASIAET